jgi:hypothetical protein
VQKVPGHAAAERITSRVTWCPGTAIFQPQNRGVACSITCVSTLPSRASRLRTPLLEARLRPRDRSRRTEFFSKPKGSIHGTYITLTASDGHKLGAYRVHPPGTPKGGIVVIQEIFGVNHHIRSVADHFVALGYVAIAPTLFDRIKAGFESGYSSEEVQRAMRFVASPPMRAWMLDAAAAREANR